MRAVVEGIVAADNARDLERVLGYYRPDAVLHPPGEPPVSGKEAIMPRYEALFSGYDPAISTDVQSIRVCGTLAVAAGRNEGILRGRGDEEDLRLADAFVMVLTLDDGRWSISRLMWHADRERPPRMPTTWR